MKQYIFRYLTLILLVWLFGVSSSVCASNLDSLWIKANDAYSISEYNNALTLYETIENSNKVSAPLYYNMGNTYFKLNKKGKAILYFEKALKLDPSNNDIKKNLELARLRTVDKIDVIPEFILTTLLKNVRNSLSSDMWAVTTVFLLIVTILLLLLYKFAPSSRARKFSFAGAILVFLFFIVSFIFSLQLRNIAIESDYAIISSVSSSVKSAPNTSESSLFILHEGTKVEVLETVGTWSKIELSDGRQGWMEKQDYQVI